MTPADTRAEVRSIIAQVEQSDDPRQGVQLIRQRMSELRDAGEEVPEEFTRVEKQLIADCIDASQGR